MVLSARRQKEPDDSRPTGGARPVPPTGDDPRSPRLPPDKAARIRFEERPEYLYAFVSGEEDSLAVSLDYWNRVLEECERRGTERLLVEETFQNQLPLTDMYDVCSTLSGYAATRRLKIAFVDRELTHRELNEFGGTVAVNRGVFARVFSEVEGAEAWLTA